MKVIASMTLLMLLTLGATNMNAQVLFIDNENAAYIDAAAYSPGSNALLFFSGTSIMVYDLASEELTESVWYDLGGQKDIDAALSWDDDIILVFSGNEYREFFVPEARFTGERTAWNGLPEEWDNEFDAVVRWSENEVIFFKEAQYLIYDLNEGTYSTFDNYTVWEGFPVDWQNKLEAVFNVGGDVYFLNDGEATLYSTAEEIFYQTTTIGFEK